jgi:RecA-family ATPase
MADLMNFDEFMDQPLLAEDWVIPELLDRNDRLVITGTEGAGKSIWMRQMAVCAAAGLHPFLGTNCDPKTVLFVDAENPAKIMVKTMAGCATPPCTSAAPSTRTGCGSAAGPRV